MRKIANAIDKAPKVIAAKTTEFELGVQANGEKERGGPKNENRQEKPGDRPGRDLQRHQQPRLFDQAGVCVSRRQRRLLGVGLGPKRREIIGGRLCVGEGRPDRQQCRVYRPAAPNRRVGLLNSLLDPVAHRLGLGSILRERLIQPQDLGGEILHVGPLSRIIGKADADEGSKDQRQEKADQPGNLADHGLRLAGLVVRQEPRLQSEAGKAGGHEQDENQYADEEDLHVFCPPAMPPASAVPERIRNFKRRPEV